MTHTSAEQELQAPIKMHPGDDLHLTVLMASHGLNFVTGKDREQLLAWGRDVWQVARSVNVVPEALTAQEENHGEHLFDAVLNCPHSISAESVTLHFCPKQKEGYNALSQLRHRLATHDLAARQRELQLLGEIEALERLALRVLKQLGAEATPIAWYVTGCNTLLDEHDAKSEAKRCGGSAKAVPLYTSPPAKHGLDAQMIKHISALSELVRMPNAEYFADAHNAAVRHLRALAAQAKQGGAT